MMTRADPTYTNFRSSWRLAIHCIWFSPGKQRVHATSRAQRSTYCAVALVARTTYNQYLS